MAAQINHAPCIVRRQADRDWIDRLIGVRQRTAPELSRAAARAKSWAMPQ
jgi:hypothetical protein